MELEIAVKATGSDRQQLATLGAAVGTALAEAFEAAARDSNAPQANAREGVEPR